MTRSRRGPATHYLADRLLADLARLQDRLWLVLDDLYELRSEEARKQVELLAMRAPPQLRIVLATRHDMRLGLHRPRPDSELSEIRSDSLRFTMQEAHKLFQAAGVKLSAQALATLHERADGWAAGLRLAALSLIGHPDPDRFAAEFSGTKRTAAEYLLAEVLARQPSEVRRLLLCSSGLDRVSGELANLLTGMSGGERMLQDLEEANAFVVSLDTSRSWFRYHHLFAELLRLELRRSEPDLVSALHLQAAGWLAGHGCPVEAVRHAQAGGDWDLAARLLADSWPACTWTGRSRRCTRWSAPSRRGQQRTMRSWRRWLRPASWRWAHWRARSNSWPWPSRAWHGCQGTGAPKR